MNLRGLRKVAVSLDVIHNRLAEPRQEHIHICRMNLYDNYLQMAVKNAEGNLTT